MNRKQRQQNGGSDSTPVAMAAAPTPSIRPLTPPQRGGSELSPPPGAQGRAAASRPSVTPGVEETRIRAYEVYLARNGRNGTPEGDWLQAEREIRERAGRAAP